MVQNYDSGLPADNETNVRTEYSYDEAGNLLSIKDGNNHTSQQAYDALNRLTTESDPLSNQTSYVYDALGNLTQMTDAKGATTNYGYDTLNRLVSIDYPSPDADVSFGYDALSRRTAMTDGVGNTSWVYDSLSRATSITDPFSGVVGYSYDALGNRTSLTYPDTKTVGYAYDDANRLTTVTDWDLGVTSYVYDLAGRIDSLTRPNGVSSSYGFDDADRLLSISHDDGVNNLASYVYTYDPAGNRTQVVETIVEPEPPGPTPTPTETPTLTPTYTPTPTETPTPTLTPTPTNTPEPINANMCYAIASSGGSGGGDDLATIVDVTDFNTSTNETDIGTGTGTNGIESAAFDAATETLYAVDTGASPDQLGTIDLGTGAFSVLSSDTGLEDISGLAFDPTSGDLYAVVKVTSQNGKDRLYQLDAATGAFVTDAFGSGVHYVEIDKFGPRGDVPDIAIDPTDGQMYAIVAKDDGTSALLASVDKTSGSAAQIGSLGIDGMEGLTFHNDGSIFGTTGTNAGADSDKVWEISKSTGAAANPRTLDNAADYGALDCPVGGGVVLQSSPQFVSHEAPSRLSLAPSTNLYSAASPSRTQPGAPANPAFSPPGVVTVTTITYTYDPLNRLTAADYDSGEIFHYTYDAVGNRLTETDASGTTTYTYDNANRLIDVGGVTLTWDNNGNLLNDGTNTYTYDAANRLARVDDGVDVYTYAYNGLGDRLQQTVGAQTTNYSVDLNTGLTQVLADGTNAYLYGMERLAEDDGVAWEYHLPDALGSVRQLADAQVAIDLAQSYEPYGEVFTSVGEGESNYGFTGEWELPTGLVYLRARYYQPVLSIFSSKDPYRGVTTIPQSYNPYQYSFNNPILYTDPTGEFPHIIAAGLLGGLIGVIGGGIFATLTYDWALAGDCGCDMQAWALSTNRSQHISKVVQASGVVGVVAAAFAASGPAAPIVVGAVGLTLSSVDALTTVWEARARGGFTRCDVLRLTIDVVGALVSARMIRTGVQALQVREFQSILPNYVRNPRGVVSYAEFLENTFKQTGSVPSVDNVQALLSAADYYGVPYRLDPPQGIYPIHYNIGSGIYGGAGGNYHVPLPRNFPLP